MNNELKNFVVWKDFGGRTAEWQSTQNGEPFGERETSFGRQIKVQSQW